MPVRAAKGAHETHQPPFTCTVLLCAPCIYVWGVELHLLLRLRLLSASVEVGSIRYVYLVLVYVVCGSTIVFYCCNCLYPEKTNPESQDFNKQPGAQELCFMEYL